MIVTWIKVPPLVAYILTGVIIRPYGLSIIQGQGMMRYLAERGIILMLFTISLEFSFNNLWKIRLIEVAGGALQVSLL